MELANFKNISTGKYLKILGYKLKGSSTGMKYYDSNWNELVDDKGEPYLSLASHIEIEADEVVQSDIRIGYNENAKKKDMMGIKEIATRHAMSDDGRHTANKNMMKELRNK